MTASNTEATRAGYSSAVVAVASAAIVFAWMWFAVMLGEAYDEECKARAAGTSEVGFLLLLGVAPLVLASAGALLALVLTTRGRARRRLGFGGGVFLVATVAGVLAAWAFSGWTLFGHLAIGGHCVA
jgi:hypothetical protein